MVPDTPRRAKLGVRWVQWLSLVCALIGAMAGCVWMMTVHIKKDVLPFEPQYPRANPHPQKMLTIKGTLSPTLPVQFIAYYSASRPWFSEAGYDSCYRSEVFGPIRRLHVSEPLESVRDGNDYKVTVVVDKYEPGLCRWRLAAVFYRLEDGIDAQELAIDPSWPGTPIVNMVRNDATWPENGMPNYGHGSENIWCAKVAWAKDPQHAESCGAIEAFSDNSHSALVPADQRGTQLSTGAYPEDQSVEINFRDLDALK
jgi:hypothetical protein